MPRRLLPFAFLLLALSSFDALFICGQSPGQWLENGPYETVETPAGTFEAYTLVGRGGEVGASGD